MYILEVHSFTNWTQPCNQRPDQETKNHQKLFPWPLPATLPLKSNSYLALQQDRLVLLGLYFIKLKRYGLFFSVSVLFPSPVLVRFIYTVGCSYRLFSSRCSMISHYKYTTLYHSAVVGTMVASNWGLFQIVLLWTSWYLFLINICSQSYFLIISGPTVDGHVLSAFPNPIFKSSVRKYVLGVFRNLLEKK